MIPLQVKRLLPNLHIFNARPIDKSIKHERGEIFDTASHNAAYEEEIHEEKDQKEKRDPKFKASVQKQGANLDAEKELKRKRTKENDKLSTEVTIDEEDDISVEKEKKKKKSKGEQENLGQLGVEKEFIQKGRKPNDKLLKKGVSVHEGGIMIEEKSKKKKIEKRAELDIIDDGGTSFAELFTTDVADSKEDGKIKMVDRAGQDTKSAGSIVTYPVRKRKKKSGLLPELQLSPAVEVGMGGPSTWDDE